jgi:hypothetical protein
MITQRGWLIPIGMPGSVCLYKPTGRIVHAQFAEEAAADVLLGIKEKNGKSQADWKTIGRNEMGDTVAGAAALLSTLGVRPDAASDTKESRRAARKCRKAEVKAEAKAKVVVIQATAAQPAPTQSARAPVGGMFEPVKTKPMRRASWASRW